MSSVTRLSSGDVIQVREGVLQGIGPEGPIGPQGPDGPQGDPGPQGLPGPPGSIEAFYAKAHNQGSPQSVGNNSDTALSFPTVEKDQPGVMTSLANITLPVGLWQVYAAVQFTKPTTTNASGWRRLALTYDGAEQSAVTSPSIPDIDTWLSGMFMVSVTAAGRVAQVRVKHSDAVSLAVSATVFVSRIGPGPVGPDGEQGPEGPPGDIGPTGPIGPPGSLVSNTTTFASIGG